MLNSIFRHVSSTRQRGTSFLLFGLLIFLLGGCAQNLRQEQHGLLNNQAPSILYTKIDYSDLESEALLGKTTVVSFWDANCSRCKKIIPEVNELARGFMQSERAVFLAVSVNRREEEEKVKDQISYLALDGFTHIFSGYGFEDEAYRAFQGMEVPYFVIVDPQGIVRWIGFDADDLKEEFFKVYNG